MSKMTKVVIVFTCILAASIIGIGITLGVFFSTGNSIEEFSDIFGGKRFKINESISLDDLDGVSAIEIDCASTDIHIVESEKPEVLLKGLVVSPRPREEYLSVEKRDGTLYIKLEYDRHFFSIVADFDLTVYLPADNMFDASVDCSSGDIDITGMNFGDLNISRASGDVKLSGCTAKALGCNASSGDTVITSSVFSSASVVSLSGDTRINGASGPLRVRSTSGDVNIEGSYGALDIGCTSGDVYIDLENRKIEPIAIGVTSGNVRLSLSSEAAFDLEAKTTSGGISSDIDIAVSGKISGNIIGKNISGTSNGGGALVSITVTSGDIRITGK